MEGERPVAIYGMGQYITQKQESQVGYLGQVYFILVLLLSWMLSLCFLKHLRSSRYSLPVNWIRLPSKGGTQGLAFPTPTVSQSQAIPQLCALHQGMPV